ncbi:hypothetical protein TNCV_1357791 [Trichonephila clavipes]|uniref:Uncharacterized protein n=1 Tax=Trichonephila clavipes TaxID=2585209 RepID=A0A8X6SJY5_TRICX|nr:hypothetical protein TNCV_1357791 [Trichonephila clavipes]
MVSVFGGAVALGKVADVFLPRSAALIANLHLSRVSGAGKECWIYPMDPRTDAVALYSGCTPALIGTGGEPKSVKRLRSGDLLIETSPAVQTKSFLLAKSFLGSPVNNNST